MRPIVVTVGPLAAASSSNIATAQTLPAAGPLTLNGAAVSNGMATLDQARRVLLTSNGNDTGIIFTITGIDRAGQPQSETLAGGNAAGVASALDYAAVSSIVTSGATASTVTAGTNTMASSAYARMDEYAANQLGGNVVVTGAGTWVLEGSFDDPNSPTFAVPPSAMAWFPIQDGTQPGPVQVASCPLFLRVTVLTGACVCRATLMQYAELSSLK